MPDFEEYLAEIRTRLGVDPARAAEIIDELRTHLESRAAQHQSSGLNRRRAVEEAMQKFGEPAAVAERLSTANGSRLLVGPFRTILSLLIAFGGLLIAVSVLESEPELVRRLDRAIAECSSLRPHDLEVLAMILLSTPVAPLAGLLARRRWWLAAAPPVAWGFALWALIVADLIITGPPLPQWVLEGEGPYSLMLVFIGGPLLAALGWIGARAARSPGHASAARAIGGTYLVGFGTLALFLQVHDLVGQMAVAGIAGLIVGVLGLALLWQKGNPWRRAAFAGLGTCLIILGMMLASIHADPDRKVGIWSAVIVTEVVVFSVVGIMSRRLDARSRPSTST